MLQLLLGLPMQAAALEWQLLRGQKALQPTAETCLGPAARQLPAALALLAEETREALPAK